MFSLRKEKNSHLTFGGGGGGWGTQRISASEKAEQTEAPLGAFVLSKR